MEDPSMKVVKRTSNAKSLEAQKAFQKEYEQRIDFLAKVSCTPRQEVDRVMNYVTQALQKDKNCKLDAHDISCQTQVKEERVLALIRVVSMMPDPNVSRYAPYVTKATFR